jgi:DNA-binding MarR family transcriptional regulator
MYKEEDLERLNRFFTLEMVERERRQNIRGFLSGQNELFFFHPSPEFRELKILLEIEKREDVTQKLLSERTNIVPSMVNNYLKDMVAKGLLEMRGRTRRKTTYHLTPLGIQRKKLLLLSYIREMFRLYKEVKDEFCQRLLAFYDEGIRKIVLYGAGELTVLLLSSMDGVGLKVVGIVDSNPGKQGERLFGITVASPSKIEEMRPDAVIITSLSHCDEIHKNIKHLEEKEIKIKEF